MTPHRPRSLVPDVIVFVLSLLFALATATVVTLKIWEAWTH
jgi:hypothetical protein